MTISFKKIAVGTKRRSLFLSALLLPFLSAAFPAWAAPPAGYNLVWSDEFNGPVGSAPNPANWTYDTGDGGWGNSELENYTNSTNNSRIVSDTNATDGSALAIIAIDTQPGNPNYGTVGRYTSARLLTSGLQSFQYGYMEARIQMPYGDGIWPAYWMLGNNIGSVGWPACGEMDIMENIGNSADQPLNHSSLHAPNWNPTGTYTLPGGALYHNAYHTFAALWQPNQIQFYVDGVLFETQNSAGAAGAGGTYEFNSSMFFLLNLAVGGSWPGSPDAGTSFPQTMLVDYVRVYQPSAGTPTPTPTPVVASTWRVVAGGAQTTDSQGHVWSADENYTGGTSAVVSTNAITGSLPGAGDQALYQSQRYGNPFSYVFNVPAGSYQVTLKFAENYWTAAGDRVFNVSINGNTVLTNFDIFKSAGGENIALDEVFNNIAPAGGAITIQFGPASVDNAMVDAIQIIPEPATPTPSPTITNSPTSTKTATPTKTPSPTATTTFTATKTPSATPSSTATPSATASQSPTMTNTPTLSTPTWTTTTLPTSTVTSTPSGTLSPTPTPTWTALFTSTATPTKTLTSTPTPTSTLSYTPTESSTITHTFTPTMTKSPTETATFTPTSSSTGTATPSPTKTFTPPPTATWTDTMTPSPTPTNTSTAIDTPTPTATAQMPVGIPIPFPNPSTGPGPVQVQILLKQPAAWLAIKVYTLAFRMVNEQNYQNLPAGPNDFPLSPTGKGGAPLANGLYYLEATTPQGHSVGKWLILR